MAAAERMETMPANAIIQNAFKENRLLLTEIESKDLLSQADVPVVPARLAKTKEEAVKISREIGFPVALKIVSPDITHKSDAGGVKLGLTDQTQVEEAFESINKSIASAFPKAKIEGVSVQKTARQGIEIIIGMTKDAQFGPVLMFGLGGILVEVLKDVSFRLIPLTKRDAGEMIREIKGYPLLKGYRGMEPADMDYLENLVVKISDFIDKHPEIKELDCNPVFVYKDGAAVVDARIILEPQNTSQS
jgi:acyl-CoA synthetase (NDP forming)